LILGQTFENGFKEMFDQKQITLVEGFPTVKIREYNFHPLNANIAWEGLFFLFLCFFV